jgi:hypothetical protein
MLAQTRQMSSCCGTVVIDNSEPNHGEAEIVMKRLACVVKDVPAEFAVIVKETDEVSRAGGCTEVSSLGDTNVAPRLDDDVCLRQVGGAAVHHEHDFDLPGLRSGRCDSRRKFDWSVSHREDNHGD